MEGILAGIRRNCNANSGSVPVGTWEAFVNTMIDGPFLMREGEANASEQNESALRLIG